jgi:REP element-mobilizing transposase RayT
VKTNPGNHHRRSIRLRSYDYSLNGAYFITICIHHHECVLGEISQNQMAVNAAGEMVAQQWEALTQRFSSLQLDEFIVMPNHIHGILVFDNEAENSSKSTLGDIVGAFKSITTHEYINGVKQHNWQAFDKKFWQRNYYEHIIRSEESLNQVREYIIHNPANWPQDENNPGIYNAK